MEIHLSSSAPRAKIWPVSGERKAEKGGWAHLSGSAGTESRWELKRMEEREGFEHGQVKRRRSLLGTNSRILDWMPMDWAWVRRKETGAVQLGLGWAVLNLKYCL